MVGAESESRPFIGTSARGFHDNEAEPELGIVSEQACGSQVAGRRDPSIGIAGPHEIGVSIGHGQTTEDHCGWSHNIDRAGAYRPISTKPSAASFASESASSLGIGFVDY